MNETAARPRSSLFSALRYAVNGITYAFNVEPNMKRHFWLFNTLALIELILRPSLTVVAISLFVAMCVFGAELANTAVELTIDLTVDRKYHAAAGIAKDAMAGAVTMISFGALLVAVWILVSTRPWRFQLFSDVHPVATGLVIISVVTIWVLRFRPYREIQLWTDRKEVQDEL
ncbi:diacylglycerol kinase [Alicyclobacillus dauci]|uniref:Diacylglycerol kinase n=1 Tax=Alicyclobacillus dauci TaxID=1475485 RepID=A0ABY6Z6Q2_9BACL|nr:diacylglycerol kinase [Alicyclobacillus dauci]WAH38550.1 diacylglycerol kinase [Alicyclobacillus dauci]